jgi:hypothetical protein
MTVQQILAGSGEYDVTGAGYEVEGEVRKNGRPVSAEEGSPLYLTLLAGAL